jgi:DNA repair protein RadC
MRAGNLLGIELIDHIIVTTGSFISLKEKSLI